MYLEVLKQQERFSLCFWTLNDRNKDTTKAFSCSKLAGKLCMLYLEV